MGLLLTPRLLNPNPAQAPYRALALAQMRILTSYMGTAGLNVHSRTVTLANGVVIICKKCFNLEEVFIDIPISGEAPYTEEIKTITGVIFHPRSGAIQIMTYTQWGSDGLGGVSTDSTQTYGVRGGWAYGRTELSTDYLFPLVADNASFMQGSTTVRTLQDDVEVASDTEDFNAFTQPGLYGNLYWDNGAVFDAGSKKWDKPYAVVSWRGTPTRHFRLGSSISVDGLSMMETSIPLGTYENMPQYTTFGTALYQGGEVLYTAPAFSWPRTPSEAGGKCLILGATASHLVTQNDHFGAPLNFWMFSDGATLSGDDPSVVQAHLDLKNNVSPNPDPPTVLLRTLALAKPGFFLGVWTRRVSMTNGVPRNDKLRVGGWELVAEFPYSRVGLPFFGSQDETSFVCGNGDRIDLTVSDDDTAAAFTPHSAVGGTYSETDPDSTSDTWLGTVTDVAQLRIEASVPRQAVFSEYSGNDPVSAESDFSFVSQGGGTGKHDMECSHNLYLGDVVVPLVYSHRHFSAEYGGATDGATPCHCQEDYEITTSYLHHLDLRYGICLYFKVKEYVQFDITTSDTQSVKEPWQVGWYHEVKIRTSNFISRREEAWHLVKDGADTVLTSAVHDLSPFPDVLLSGGIVGTTMADYIANGNYIGSGGSLAPFDPDYAPDIDIRQILLFPQPPSLGIPWSDDIRYFGFYDYGNMPGDESELNRDDGGNKDMFFPQWCRELQANPFMTAAAASRYMMDWFHGPLQAMASYSLPAIPVNPIPIGSFVRHPQFGDIYQFLITNGNAQYAWTSPGLQEAVDAALAKQKDVYGNSLNLATHDTTLYYPISIA